MRTTLAAAGTMVAFLAVAPLSAREAPSQSTCVTCHEQVTPGIVKQFLSGEMGKSGDVDCSDCHGSAHVSAKDVDKVTLPTPATCAECHEDQVQQYEEGKHSLAWVAMEAMPMMGHQPTPIKGKGYKGCAGCHKIGKKDAKKIGVHYGTGACDSCHTRHTFSKAEAKDPRACQTCHMGFDHPQWEMWSTSKHGTIWAIEKGSDRAPTCQTCHMKDGDHRVMTSWGFLALRLPEDDKEWLADRVVILQALGVLDGKGNPTARLDAVKAAKMARLTRKEFQDERDEMLGICSQCHARSYAKEQLDAGDALIKEVDRIMAQAILEVKGLYDDGILKKPDGWAFAPDLLQFYEAPSAPEQHLWVMFMEYRMRTFQGAFHMNPDYMHWYGWAPMKETLALIKAEAASLRAEAKK
ncbi:MAG: cytochrome C [Deltaproteobacteria bacterium]|nr:cytochrome C [Deltaproteobacteria bacterium]